jgi:rhodanese-related sulfurtransferase
MKEYRVMGGRGRLLQGGADATQDLYRTVRAQPDGAASGYGGSLIIVNVARRTGEPKMEHLPGGRILWLPMVEGDRRACDDHLERYASDLLGTLSVGGTVVVNCQEGLHRSVMFVQQLMARAAAIEGDTPEPEPEPEPTPTPVQPMAFSSLAPTLERHPTLELPELASGFVDVVDPSELAGLLAEGAVTVVDVRSTKERADGYVAGSVHVPSERWERWHRAPGQSPVRQELQLDAKDLLTAAAAEDKLVLFHCMYSKERAPRVAQEAAEAEPEARIAVLRGGFQRLMAQFWRGSDDAEESLLFKSVQCDQWVPNGRQGLVWKPDMEPLHMSSQPQPEPEA